MKVSVGGESDEIRHFKRRDQPQGLSPYIEQNELRT